MIEYGMVFDELRGGRGETRGQKERSEGKENIPFR
jgi:hypothetical protein